MSIFLYSEASFLMHAHTHTHTYTHARTHTHTHTHFSKSTTVLINNIMKSIFQCQAPLEASQSVLESYYKTNVHTSTVVAPQGTEHS